MNITLDGMNIQDNYNKSNEIFTRVSPRLDAVEEMTFTSAAQGADAGGGGAVQIRFATRSGSNQLRGSSYFYYQTDKLNGNTWFNERDNLPKPALTLYQPGIRLGGPVVIPRLFDGHNRLFFFINYEEERQPRTITDNRTMLVPAALQDYEAVREELGRWKAVERSAVPAWLSRAWFVIIPGAALLEALAIGSASPLLAGGACVVLMLVVFWSLAQVLRSHRLSLRARALSLLLLVPVAWLAARLWQLVSP